MPVPRECGAMYLLLVLDTYGYDYSMMRAVTGTECVCIRKEVVVDKNGFHITPFRSTFINVYFFNLWL